MSELQPFEPDPHTVYSIDAAAHLAQVSRHSILVYFKQGLIDPIIDPADGSYYFNEDMIRILRRIEYLRLARHLNLAGIKLALKLMQEVEHLQRELKFYRG